MTDEVPRAIMLTNTMRDFNIGGIKRKTWTGSFLEKNRNKNLRLTDFNIYCFSSCMIDHIWNSFWLRISLIGLGT